MWGWEEGVEDRVEKKFAKVVDGVGDQRRYAEVVCPGLGVGGREGREVNAGEVEECVFVVGAEIEVGLGGREGLDGERGDFWWTESEREGEEGRGRFT